MSLNNLLGYYETIEAPGVAFSIVKRDVKLAVILLTGLSGAALLTGCSISELKNPFGSQRSDQVVSGARHTPIYNTVDEQKIAQMKAQAQPAPQDSGPVISRLPLRSADRRARSKAIRSIITAPLRLQCGRRFARHSESRTDKGESKPVGAQVDR